MVDLCSLFSSNNIVFNFLNIFKNCLQVIIYAVLPLTLGWGSWIDITTTKQVHKKANCKIYTEPFCFLSLTFIYGEFFNIYVFLWIIKITWYVLHAWGEEDYLCYIAGAFIKNGNGNPCWLMNKSLVKNVIVLFWVFFVI